MNRFSIDAMQMFPRGTNAKNGADIRMVIDVMNDLSALPHIDLVVILSGDLDYIALVNEIKRRGKSVLGIGVIERTNNFLVSACHEFVWYSTLDAEYARRVYRKGASEPDVKGAFGLFEEANKQIGAAAGSTKEKLGALKVRMKMLQQDYLNRYGFASFAELIKKCMEYEKQLPEPEPEPAPAPQGAAPVEAALPAEPEAAGPPEAVAVREPFEDTVEAYRKVISERYSAPPSSEVLLSGIRALVSEFENDSIGVPNLSDFEEYLKGYFSLAGMEASLQDRRNIRKLIWDSKGFYLDPNTNHIKLNFKCTKFEAMMQRLVSNLVELIEQKLGRKCDYAVVSRLIYGDGSHAEEIRQMVERNREELQQARERMAY